MQELLFGISKSSKPNSNLFFTKNVQNVQNADFMNGSCSR